MGPHERQAFLINDRSAARNDRKGEWDARRNISDVVNLGGRRPRLNLAVGRLTTPRSRRPPFSAI